MVQAISCVDVILTELWLEVVGRWYRYTHLVFSPTKIGVHFSMGGKLFFLGDNHYSFSF